MRIGEDNATRWMQIRRLVEGLNYTCWINQTIRWIIALQFWAVMRLFGTNSIFLLRSTHHHRLGAPPGRRLSLAAAIFTALFPHRWPNVAVSFWLIRI